MKYVRDRHFLHPVLRPDADDYPHGSFAVPLPKLSPAEDDGNIRIEMSFDLEEESIRKAVLDGYARCGAVLRCSPTLHRTLMAAHVAEFSLDTSQPRKLLQGRVEVDPLIYVCEDMRYQPRSVHSEYGENAFWHLGPGQLLAQTKTWVLPLSSPRTIRSLVHWRIDEELEDGMFRVEAEVSKSHLVIGTNQATRKELMPLEDNVTLPSFYTGAIFSALTDTVDLEAGLPEDENCEWLTVLHDRLKACDIDSATLGTRDGMSLWEATQKILGLPYRRMWSSEEVT